MDGLKLLSLDGGGIRGLSSLYILKGLMNTINNVRDDSLKPCDVFDIIGGTSTGGLIAMMIGRVKMSTDEAIDAYGRLTNASLASRNKMPPRKRQKHRNRSMYVLPGKMNNCRVCALPDTGAERNIMSIAFAKKFGFWIDNSETHSFVLPNNKTTKSLGTVTEPYYFEEEAEPHTVKFDILRHPPHDLILGDLFLSRTETLTTNSHRLQKELLANLNFRPFCSMNSSRTRLAGKLGGENALALPDTGCMANLISLNYALEHGLRISTAREDRGYLRYADGQVEPTIGRVTIPWAFADQPEDSFMVDFEVVADCRYDVILGQHTLLDEQAYTKHSGSFVADIRDEEAFELSPVAWTPHWVEKCRRKTSKPSTASTQSTASPASLDDLMLSTGSLQTYREFRDLELERRTNADRLLENMSEPEKTRAEEQENSKRATWDVNWHAAWLRQNNTRPSFSSNPTSLTSASSLTQAESGKPP